MERGCHQAPRSTLQTPTAPEPASHLRDVSPLLTLVDKMWAHLEATAPPPVMEGDLLPTMGRAAWSHTTQGTFFIPVPSSFPFWCPPLCSCSMAPASLGGVAPGGPIRPKCQFWGSTLSR